MAVEISLDKISTFGTRAAIEEELSTGDSPELVKGSPMTIRNPKIGEDAMLVLTRKRDETIKIGSNIVIRVMKTAKGSVKIGIDAPDSVRILRGEVATVEASAPFDASDEEVSFELNYEEEFDECMLEAMLVQS